MQQAESAKTSTQNFKVQHPLAVGLVSFRTKQTFLALKYHHSWKKSCDVCNILISPAKLKPLAT